MWFRYRIEKNKMAVYVKETFDTSPFRMLRPIVDDTSFFDMPPNAYPERQQIPESLKKDLLTMLKNGIISKAYEPLIISLRCDSKEAMESTEDAPINESKAMTQFCPLCNRTYEETLCEWLRCEKCDQWFCFDCINHYTKGKFICELCN